MPETPKRDITKPITESLGGYFPGEGQALELGKVNTAPFEYAAMNLRVMLEHFEPTGDPMSADELGSVILFADLGASAGRNLVDWCESIRADAIALYWEERGPDGQPRKVVPHAV